MEIILDPKDIIEKSNSIIGLSNKLHNDILKGNIDIISALADDIAKIKTTHSTLSFLSHVSPDSEIRDACHQADNLFNKYTCDLRKRKDIYNYICELLKSDATFDTNDKILLNGLVEKYQKIGIDKIYTDEYTKLQYIIKTLSDTIHTKSTQLTIIKLSKEDLEGIPKKQLQLYPYNSKTKHFTIELTSTTYNILIKYLTKEHIRQKLENSYYSNFYHAKDILKLLVAKHEYAKLLGYDSYLDYQCKHTMACSIENVKTFLNTIIEKLDQSFLREFQQLIQLKNNDKIGTWDIPYYLNIWKNMYGINDYELREYFPLDHVITQTFKIYQDLFNIKCKKVKSTAWHDDVKVYKLVDIDTKETLGIVYLDLINRNNKTAHAGCYELVPGCYSPYREKNYTIPVSALIMNISQDKLMYFSEVVTFFSQFAHIIHHVSYKSPIALFTGLSECADYINIPVLVFENIVWQKENIIKLSKHNKTNTPIPEQNVIKLCKTRFLDTGLRLKQQLLMSTFDMIIHSKEFNETAKQLLHNNNDTEIGETFRELYGQLHNTIMTTKMNTDLNIVININNKICPVSKWNFINSVDAGRYYTTIWSFISAADIYYTKFMGNTREKPGIKFRELVLKYNYNTTNNEKLYKYMGRKFEIDNFLYLNGININTSEYSMFFKNNKNNLKTKPKPISDSNFYDDESSPYITENSETLPKYKNIFAKQSD